MNITPVCQCGSDSNSKLSEREKELINLAYRFAVRDTVALKKSIISSKNAGITVDEIKEVCDIVAQNTKASVLALLDDKNPVKSNRCCV